MRAREEPLEESGLGLRREEIIFARMKGFHRERVTAIANGEGLLEDRAGGILILHLIPESVVLSRRLLDGTILKEYGTRICPLNFSGGNTRFNVDGFISWKSSERVRAYSQLFRNGWLESATSDVGFPVNRQMGDDRFAFRGSTELSVFNVVREYLKFCEAAEFEPPVWLFAALVECTGFRMVIDRSFGDVAEKGVDRSPAILPEFEITNFDTEPQQLLHPWCDSLWQASGLERSLSYDQDGNWR